MISRLFINLPIKFPRLTIWISFQVLKVRQTSMNYQLYQSWAEKSRKIKISWKSPWFTQFCSGLFWLFLRILKDQTALASVLISRTIGPTENVFPIAGRAPEKTMFRNQSVSLWNILETKYSGILWEHKTFWALSNFFLNFIFYKFQVLDCHIEWKCFQNILRTTF